MKILEILAKISVIYGIFMVLSIVKDITSSGFDGDFELYGKDKQGKVRVGRISARKTMPERTPLNLMGYSYNTTGMSEVTYGRHIIQFGDFHIYGIGGVGVHPESIVARIGVTVTF